MESVPFGIGLIYSTDSLPEVWEDPIAQREASDRLAVELRYGLTAMEGDPLIPERAKGEPGTAVRLPSESTR
jgi:hypothetical protein